MRPFPWRANTEGNPENLKRRSCGMPLVLNLEPVMPFKRKGRHNEEIAGS